MARFTASSSPPPPHHHLNLRRPSRLETWQSRYDLCLNAVGSMSRTWLSPLTRLRPRHRRFLGSAVGASGSARASSARCDAQPLHSGDDEVVDRRPVPHRVREIQFLVGYCICPVEFHGPVLNAASFARTCRMPCAESDRPSQLRIRSAPSSYPGGWGSVVVRRWWGNRAPALDRSPRPWRCHVRVECGWQMRLSKSPPDLGEIWKFPKKET